jgi:hypothetical protein
MRGWLEIRWGDWYKGIGMSVRSWVEGGRGGWFFWMG